MDTVARDDDREDFVGNPDDPMLPLDEEPRFKKSKEEVTQAAKRYTAYKVA